jgi:hypothetical protein
MTDVKLHWNLLTCGTSIRDALLSPYHYHYHLRWYCPQTGALDSSLTCASPDCFASADLSRSPRSSGTLRIHRTREARTQGITFLLGIVSQDWPAMTWPNGPAEDPSFWTNLSKQWNFWLLDHMGRKYTPGFAEREAEYIALGPRSAIGKAQEIRMVVGTRDCNFDLDIDGVAYGTCFRDLEDCHSCPTLVVAGVKNCSFEILP